MKRQQRIQQAGLALVVLVLAACSAVPAQTLPQEATDPAPTPTEAMPAAVLEAQKWLALQLGVEVEQVALTGHAAAEWSDSCLGLGQAHEACLAAITPGWRADFEVKGLPFEVRTDETGAVVRVAPPEQGDALSGTAWQLVSFDNAGGTTPVAVPGSITLSFAPDGLASGLGGCNSFSGLYRAHEGQLLFGLISSTLMACADEDLMGQEMQFYAALQSASAYTLAENALTITYAGGRLTLAPLAPETAMPEARVPGIIDFYADGSAGVITAPTTVVAGEEFEITLLTFGGGCERAGEASGVTTALGADVLVYDFTTAVSPNVACEAMLKRLEHKVLLRFDQPGETVIRVWGRRVGTETALLGEPTVIQHTVTVQ